MVCAPVRSMIPLLKLGDYLSVQVQKPCSICEGIIPLYMHTNHALSLTSTTFTALALKEGIISIIDFGFFFSLIHCQQS